MGKNSKVEKKFKREREVLIKVVFQAIPIYTMSCFKLSIGIFMDIKSLIRNFW